MRGLFGSLKAAFKSTSSLALWEELIGRRYGAHSGVAVTLDTALATSTVFACTRVLSQGIAQVPAKIYREDDNEAITPAKDHPAYKLIFRRPNDWMTAFEFRETLTAHAILQHGGFAYINRVRDKPVELIPLLPAQVTPRRRIPDLALVFDIVDYDGVRHPDVPRSEILHIRGPSWNGYVGMEALRLAREAIGLAIATEESHALLHANAAQPGGILSIKGGKLDAQAKKNLTEGFEQNLRGKNKFGIAVVDVEADFKQLAMKGVDAQHLETRRFQIEEICRALGVFPQMIGHSDKTATFASAEAFFLAHVIHSLMPWGERWVQAIERDLLDNDDGLVARFSLQDLLRGDAKSRAELYASGIINGWMTRNDARRLEHLNPLTGLDVPLVPLNMGTQQERDAVNQQLREAAKSALNERVLAAGVPVDAAAIDALTEMLEAKFAHVLARHGEQRRV